MAIFEMCRFLRSIPSRERRTAFLVKAAPVLVRNRPQQAKACLDHLADLAREHDMLREAPAHDGFPRLSLPAITPLSLIGSPSLMCAEGGA